MKKKYFILGSILVILIFGIWLYLNFGITCYDGQGSTIYLPKNTLLKNINSTNASEIGKYFIPPTISSGYIAKTSTNSCGKTISRVTVENGKEKNVSQKNFDEFVSNYNTNCENCLFRLSQGGNSLLFIKEYPSGQSYVLENNNGTLIMQPTDKIANWKTYQNDQYGFLVKYPPTLKVWENQQSGKAVYGVSFENPLSNQTTAGRKMVFSIFVFNDTTQLQDAFSANSDPYRIRTAQGQVVIDGHQSQKILFEPKSPNDVEATVYLIADKNIAVMFFGTNYHKISEADMNQILSSFGFTK